MKKILLINFGGIGDEILFMPVISALKKKFPKSRITLCLESRSSAFLSLTDLIDDYFFIDIKTKNKYIEMLKLYFKAVSGRFDIVVSSGSNPLIALLLFFTGIKIRAGYAVNSFSKKFLTHPAVLNKNQYAALMYFDLVKDICGSSFELPFIKTEDIKKEENSVLIHPGASRISIQKNIIKSPDALFWADTIKKLLQKGKKVYLASGADDIECIEKIRSIIKNEDLTNFEDTAGRTKNIYDLALLIKKVQVLACADSAPMHIGAAVRTKTAAVFGPTDEKLLLPENADFTAFHNNADCRPCLWNKRQTSCRELKCLKLSSDEFVQKIINLIP